MGHLRRPRAPQEQPKSGQLRPKSGQERAKAGPRAAKTWPRAAKSGPRGAKKRQERLRRGQERTKSGQEQPKSIQEQPRSGQERPKSCPKAILEPSWLVLGRFWRGKSWLFVKLFNTASNIRFQPHVCLKASLVLKRCRHEPKQKGIRATRTRSIDR